MRLYNKHISLLLSLCALSACSEDDVIKDEPVIPDSEKTPIELSVGGVDGETTPLTRAVITDGTDKTLRAFTANTRVYTVMKAVKDETTTKWAMTWGTAAGINNPEENSKSSLTFAPAQQLYWDDAYARDTKLYIYGLAVANKIWQSATIGTVNSFSTWSTSANSLNCTLSVPTRQTSANIYDYDVCYSNNLANSSGSIDANKGPLIFNSGTKEFDKNKNMIFYRAMCLIQINIYAGDGFDLTQNTTGTDAYKAENNNFVFDNYTNKNIALNGFNYTGTFDIANGTWTSATSGNFGPIDNPNWPIGDRSAEAKAGTKPVYTLFAQLIPGTDLKNTPKDDAFDFTIDGNQYKVSMETLYNAIKDKKVNDQYVYRNGDGVDNAYLEGGTKLKQGVQYVFNFRISKTKIQNITAQVADWGVVTADEVFPSNARVTLNVEDRSSSTQKVTTDMSIYRTLDKASSITDSHIGFKWDKTYLASTNATYKAANVSSLIPAAHWETEWFWDSNDSYYHFRTLSPASQTLEGNDSKTYVTLSSSNASDADHYNQIAWGAPFKDVEDTYKFFYNWDKGFDATSLTDKEASDTDESKHQIYKAIGPTKDQIKILMFHMMSGVHFTIKTDDTKDNKVQLYNATGNKHTNVQLVGYFPNGKVYIGNGLVVADGTKNTYNAADSGITCRTTTTGEYDNQDFYLNAVPQSLTNVKLYITTPDNNQYIVNLEDVVVTSTNDITNNNIENPYTVIPTGQTNAGKYKIDSWYPGFKYNYTFTLKKTGIDNLKVTIVDWEDVKADNQTVVIQ